MGQRELGLTCFLTGLGAGITLALLFAPRSGPDSRSLIGRTVEDCEGWFKDKAAAVTTQSAGLRAGLKEAAGELIRD